MAKRVVITGLGMISPLGHDKNTFWHNLLNGHTGIGYIDYFDTSDFPVRIAAQVKDFKAEDYLPKKEVRRMDKFVQYACAASKVAVEDAGIDLTRVDREKIGVWIGSGIGGIETLEKNHRQMLEKGVGGINPFFIPMLIPNMASGQVAIVLGVKGPNGCTVTACASGTNSIGEAFRIIRDGQAEVMIAGGTEAAITPLGLGGFCAMKALSDRNDEPQKACRPFDREREGFVMGEGAGIVVLESLEHALARGAHIYAEIIGYGASADACHMVQPDEEGRGAVLAFKMALAQAGIEPEEIDYINAHGTGTRLNDVIETKVIKTVFGPYSYELPVSSIKAATGHMLGAAGAVELIASALALENNLIPPTLNLENQDPECDLDYVPLTPREKELKTVLSDSLGFGGHNAVLILRKLG
ncbi:3-oxoacyl-[acyl-carrier-protein] synthase II [Thermosyntropha lipolytica DSM 11003]|uniref:3-oxoacyl-[acyl-carrier-protein] synthase 2 n=1 Tax=Thermosyntropha lipolytica DSM 11003 TaxID=1123382 RepID=A0A1M5JDX0_9FIRM|nr:beta-ketoacyl-ACP synthase II [Thermosyntropha lipolytica]SHG38479.1 3-oxoacyl-[acyl-carrier-protein] synthase II [Thermosyntropha lipolytica DSM 11003]